ncbi:MAG: hypothetical protein NG747_09985, partial [Candidatus Brocadia sp.]|nr:hypothetical protein [Candidatus Brocadia sp.]
IGYHLFHGGEGKRPKGALSEDTTSTTTITGTIRGIADKVARGIAEPEYPCGHEKKNFLFAE